MCCNHNHNLVVIGLMHAHVQFIFGPISTHGWALREGAMYDPQQAEVARATVQRWQRWLWLATHARVRLVLYNLRAVSAMQRIPATPALQRWRKFMQEKSTTRRRLPIFSQKTTRRLLEECIRAAGDLGPCNMVRTWTSSLSGGPMRGAFAVAGLVLAPMRPGRVRVTRLSRLCVCVGSP